MEQALGAFPLPLYLRKLRFAPVLGGRRPGSDRRRPGGSRRSVAPRWRGLQPWGWAQGGAAGSGAGRGRQRGKRGSGALGANSGTRGSRGAPCLSGAGDAESVNIYPRLLLAAREAEGD